MFQKNEIPEKKLKLLEKSNCFPAKMNFLAEFISFKRAKSLQKKVECVPWDCIAIFRTILIWLEIQISLFNHYHTT